MKHLLFLLVLLVLPDAKLAAQEDWDYLFRQQYDRAVELFNHHYYHKEYKQALPHLEWMLNEKPKENVSQYLMGIDLYEKLAQVEEDPKEKYRYTQLALKLYDDRLHYFGDTSTVLNRKLQTAFQLLYQNSTYYAQLLALSEDVLRQTQKDFAYYNFMPHVYLLSQMQKKGEATDEEVKTAIEQLNDIAAHHTQAQGSSNYAEAMKKIKRMLDDK